MTSSQTIAIAPTTEPPEKDEQPLPRRRHALSGGIPPPLCEKERLPQVYIYIYIFDEQSACVLNNLV